jgi:hypothetical protein
VIISSDLADALPARIVRRHSVSPQRSTVVRRGFELANARQMRTMRSDFPAT